MNLSLGYFDYIDAGIFRSSRGSRCKKWKTLTMCVCLNFWWAMSPSSETLIKYNSYRNLIKYNSYRNYKKNIKMDCRCPNFEVSSCVLSIFFAEFFEKIVVDRWRFKVHYDINVKHGVCYCINYNNYKNYKNPFLCFSCNFYNYYIFIKVADECQTYTHSKSFSFLTPAASGRSTDSHINIIKITEG